MKQKTCKFFTTETVIYLVIIYINMKMKQWKYLVVSSTKPTCNYIHSTPNDIYTDGTRPRAKAEGHKGIRGDRRFKGRRGYRTQVTTLYNREY